MKGNRRKKSAGELSTDSLEKVLEQLHPDEIGTYLNDYTDNLIQADHAFSSYMRALIAQKKLTQREVFEQAGFSDRYGYRLLSQEKNTRQRDYVLRLCFGARLTLNETQRALKLYGMSELYSRIPRDAVLMIALNQEIHDIDKVNDLLIAHDLEPLRGVSFID